MPRSLTSAFLVACSVLAGAAPAGAVDYFVNGAAGVDDSAHGNSSAPFQTINYAMSHAFPGDTVWVDAGVYRESIDIPFRTGGDDAHRITLRARQGADVEVKASDAVTGWTLHSGAIWKRTSWAVNSQQVFVDGAGLQQIGASPVSQQTYGGGPILPPVGSGLGDLRAGSFYYDAGASVLFVWLADGSSPNNHLMEASVRPTIIPSYDAPNHQWDRNFITLQDIHFSHSNDTANNQLSSIVHVGGTGWNISNCTFNDGDFCGLAIAGENHHISDSTANRNGDEGMSVFGSDQDHGWGVWDRPPQNILIERSVTNFNNTRHFLQDWGAGGMKNVPSNNFVTISQHTAANNHGPGLWFDIACKNITVDRSLIMNNEGAGIFFEISDSATITNNVVMGQQQQGIYISASSGAQVFNNDLVDNWAGIVVAGTSDNNPRPEHPNLQNNTVRNNIISAGPASIADLILYHGVYASGNSTDYNDFAHYDASGKVNGSAAIGWITGDGYDIAYTTVAGFAAASGQDSHSFSADPLWRNKATGDDALLPGSPAIDRGTTVTMGALDFVGNPRRAGPAIDLGAFEFQGNLSTGPFQGLISVPGKLEAENFDKGGEGIAYHDMDALNRGDSNDRPGEGVDLKTLSAGGARVGFFQGTEWLGYSVHVVRAGNYGVTAHLANIADGAGFHLELDGAPLGNAIAVPNTGSYDAFQDSTVQVIALPAGDHFLRIVADGPSSGYIGDLDYLTLSLTGSAGSPARPANFRIRAVTP